MSYPTCNAEQAKAAVKILRAHRHECITMYNNKRKNFRMFKLWGVGRVEKDVQRTLKELGIPYRYVGTRDAGPWSTTSISIRVPLDTKNEG